MEENKTHKNAGRGTRTIKGSDIKKRFQNWLNTYAQTDMTDSEKKKKLNSMFKIIPSLAYNKTKRQQEAS